VEEISRLNKRRITFLVVVFSLAMITTGFLVNTPKDVFKGEWAIITSPSILITDYIALANLGSAFFNVGVVTLIGLILAWLVDATFNGYLLAGIFTMAGFAFFGKNPFNILPIFSGVYLFHRISHRQKMKDLIAPLLFGTTLGPVVSQIAFGFGLGWKGLIVGILIGIFSGMLLAALMRHIYNLHLGYNLYNTGTTGGFVALVIFMFMEGFGFSIEPQFYWSTAYTDFLSFFMLAFLSISIFLGFYWGGRLGSWKKILIFSGRLSSDFVEKVDLGTTLINMGFIGLIALGYIQFVGGDVNGPTLAGVFTVFAFGALGKHPRNILPIMLGVYLICFFKIWTHAEPGPLMAALFCTTLAPFSGQFGVLAGIAAGALHLPMVMHVGSIHGYMNLYNNGFAGGLVMLIIVGFIKSLWPHALEE
jgi:hypothetical protein